MVYKNEGYKMFENCLEKIATLTALRILNIRITLPNGVTVSPDQLRLKTQEEIDAEKAAAEQAAQNGASAPAQEADQMNAEGAKAAGLAGQAASSETNALSGQQQEQQAASQPMPQSALPGTRPKVRRTYIDPAIAAAAAAHKRAQQAGPKLGRNDPCWCGSGLKYKKCHGKDME